MRQNEKRHMDGLAALLLFGVFACCVLGVLLTGAGAYRRLTERDQASYERRTCAQYIATRVRQADRLGGVSVERFGGVPALRLTDEGGYITYVYCCEGYLMELYAAPDAELTPADGEKLLRAAGMEVSLAGGLLEVSVTGADGGVDRLYLSLRCGEGAAA